jgi:hypothetical protein
MNDGLEGVDFTDDIFGGKEDDNAIPREVENMQRHQGSMRLGQ